MLAVTLSPGVPHDLPFLPLLGVASSGFMAQKPGFVRAHGDTWDRVTASGFPIPFAPKEEYP